MNGSTSSAHRLLVSDAALEMMIQAIAVLSRRNRRFETLRHVVLHVLNSRTDLDPGTVERFFDRAPFEGPNRVHLKITREHAEAFDALKEELCARSGHNCSVKEVVCFCCFLVASDSL